jgi:hypothetical protein
MNGAFMKFKPLRVVRRAGILGGKGAKVTVGSDTTEEPAASGRKNDLICSID